MAISLDRNAGTRMLHDPGEGGGKTEETKAELAREQVEKVKGAVKEVFHGIFGGDDPEADSYEKGASDAVDDGTAGEIPEPDESFAAAPYGQGLVRIDRQNEARVDDQEFANATQGFEDLPEEAVAYRTSGGFVVVVDGNPDRDQDFQIYGPDQTYEDKPLTEVWGDPHVEEGDTTDTKNDGKWDFKDDSVFRLPDGTMIFAKTVPASGEYTYTGELTIVNGDDLVQVTGIDKTGTDGHRVKASAISDGGYEFVTQKTTEMFESGEAQDTYHLGAKGGDVRWYKEATAEEEGGLVIGSSDAGASQKVDSDAQYRVDSDWTPPAGSEAAFNQMRVLYETELNNYYSAQFAEQYTAAKNANAAAGYALEAADDAARAGNVGLAAQHMATAEQLSAVSDQLQGAMAETANAGAAQLPANELFGELAGAMGPMPENNGMGNVPPEYQELMNLLMAIEQMKQGLFPFGGAPLANGSMMGGSPAWGSPSMGVGSSANFGSNFGSMAPMFGGWLNAGTPEVPFEAYAGMFNELANLWVEQAKLRQYEMAVAMQRPLPYR